MRTTIESQRLYKDLHKAVRDIDKGIEQIAAARQDVRKKHPYLFKHEENKKPVAIVATDQKHPYWRRFLLWSLLTLILLSVWTYYVVSSTTTYQKAGCTAHTFILITVNDCK